MFPGRLRKPYKSIFDVFHTMKFLNRATGVACFSIIKRKDGVEIYFADKGDQIYSSVVTVFSTSASLMIFFCHYFPMDSTNDDLLYKVAYLYLSWSGSIARVILKIDSKLRNNGIPVDYEECRWIAKMGLVAYCTAHSVLYFLYKDEHVLDDLRIYHFVNLTFSAALSLTTLSFIFLYKLIICSTLKRRFEQLNSHFDTLRKTKNSKKLEDGLLLISDIHLKLCQSWSFSTYSMGPALILFNGVFYIYCMFPLVYFDYLLPRVKQEMVPVLILWFYLIFMLLNSIQRLKTQVQKLKNSVIEFSLEKENSIPIVRKMSSTLLLQMEHVDIRLVFGGFFVIDLESFLSRIKSTSTFMMLILQISNSDMF